MEESPCGMGDSLKRLGDSLKALGDSPKRLGSSLKGMEEPQCATAEFLCALGRLGTGTRSPGQGIGDMASSLCAQQSDKPHVWCGLRPCGAGS